ncbi:MAG: hypothetical protein IJU28_04295 [Clostridia bacterium]|nr:hypothetical protein [Clostridia bacterium]
MRFCVVGGLNLDVIGTSFEKVIMEDSNIGSIGFSAGGVGFNIARELKRLGHEVALVTALSTDRFGDYLGAFCEKEGLDLTACVRAQEPTPTYMAIHSPDGNMVCGVNDMRALKSLNRLEIVQRAAYINSFGALVTEANLEEDALLTLCEVAKVPIIADAVSANKCRRLQAALPYLSALKLNRLEAQTLSGEPSPKDAGQALLKRGAGCVLISLGSEGAYVCDRKEDAFLKPEAHFTCQTNGAGDAMCAGLAQGCAQGQGAIKSATQAMACAAKLLRSRQTITTNTEKKTVL